MEIPVKVCDINPIVGQATISYTVTQGERVVHVDLCEEHAELLEGLLSGTPRPVAPTSSGRPVATSRVSVPEGQPKPAATKRASSTPKVYSLAEIEAMKAR